MSRYLKLVDFEIKRFLKIYLVLVGVTIVSQLLGVIFTSKNYLNLANEMMYKEMLSKETFLQQYGSFSFLQVTQTTWFVGPIALCIVTLLIYVFFIWYRDWFGKNTFIYRLLMLPTARLNVYLAKATTIFLFVLGLVSIQLILLPIENNILQLIIPTDLRTDLATAEIINSFYYLAILFPYSFTEFLIYYGLGFMAVFVVFTSILFERSFRLKGVVLGVLYGGFSLLILFSPVLIDGLILVNFFYPLEIFLLSCLMAVIVTAMSIWLSNYLLKNKIRV
ncbi:hypothetical protein GMD78_13925 [Ornithinibacillus sp. L9]|uniref:ABC-2 family transporter protein n=1 Tax=Ornithinibacillus caprae TaxID=2678566 RepID=A0A6N8FJU0_9BACI|nr:hypothetical protein [Ornithinibacillus caprae]MUK89461.1 hypothetical protein [Ornithinibacillus caprae]